MDRHRGSDRRVPRSADGLSRRTVLGGAAAAALALTGCREPAAAPRPEPTKPRFPGDPGPGRLYLGASLAIDEVAVARPDLGGVAMSMVRRFYRPHQIALMVETVRTDVAAGIMPFVSFKVPGTWGDVADGGSDPWLDKLMQALDSLGSPVFVALHHEPENDTRPPDFTRSDWLAMQDRAIARSRGAKQVTVVPVLMSWSFRGQSRRDPHAWVMPDVPLLGVDVYNPWEPGGAEDWLAFVDLIAMIREVVPDRPLIIPELAASADPFDPNRAALWLRGAVDTALEEDVIGIAWFDAESDAGRDRRLDEAGRAELRELLLRPEVVRVSED
jgi:hypothetical protein